MRDYQDVGQHSLLAAGLPGHMNSDLSSLVESPHGKAENPSYPEVLPALDILGQGWGLVTLLVHGSSDGWVIRSHEYNHWPKRFIFTADNTPGTHGFLPAVPASNKPGVVYSIGCNNGAFDQDSPPWPSSNPCVAEAFLLIPDGGAVAFIGHSRWGWVSSSWRLEEAFLHYLFNINTNIAFALEYAKAQYPHYRDVVYGINLYGDPALRVWTGSPATLEVKASQYTTVGEQEIAFEVTDSAGPCSGVVIAVLSGGEIIGQGHTDAGGSVTIALDIDGESDYSILAHKAGYATVEAPLAPGIALDADDEISLPEEFTVGQNFPNPFNPSTNLRINLPHTEHVEIAIFNILGQRVATPLDQTLPPGEHKLQWNGTSDAGIRQPSGVYLARVTAGPSSKIIKMTMLK
jgi:hypothetical protein